MSLLLCHSCFYTIGDSLLVDWVYRSCVVTLVVHGTSVDLIILDMVILMLYWVWVGYLPIMIF